MFLTATSSSNERPSAGSSRWQSAKLADLSQFVWFIRCLCRQAKSCSKTNTARADTAEGVVTFAD